MINTTIRKQATHSEVHLQFHARARCNCDRMRMVPRLLRFTSFHVVSIVLVSCFQFNLKYARIVQTQLNTKKLVPNNKKQSINVMHMACSFENMGRQFLSYQCKSKIILQIKNVAVISQSS